MDTFDIPDTLDTQTPCVPIGDSRLLDLETAYITHRPGVVRSLVKRGVDAIEAEDVTQEIFLRVLGCPSDFCSQVNAGGWLKMCARNLAVDRYRRQRKEVLVSTSAWEHWETQRPDPAANAEALVCEADCCHRLREAISQLTEEEQRCLAMRNQGITFREIAAILDILPRKAIYLAEAAVDKLRRKLQPSAACDEDTTADQQANDAMELDLR